MVLDAVLGATNRRNTSVGRHDGGTTCDWMSLKFSMFFQGTCEIWRAGPADISDVHTCKMGKMIRLCIILPWFRSTGNSGPDDRMMNQCHLGTLRVLNHVTFYIVQCPLRGLSRVRPNGSGFPETGLDHTPWGKDLSNISH